MKLACHLSGLDGTAPNKVCGFTNGIIFPGAGHCCWVFATLATQAKCHLVLLYWIKGRHLSTNQSRWMSGATFKRKNMLFLSFILLRSVWDCCTSLSDIGCNLYKFIPSETIKVSTIMTALRLQLHLNNDWMPSFETCWKRCRCWCRSCNVVQVGTFSLGLWHWIPASFQHINPELWCLQGGRLRKEEQRLPRRSVSDIHKEQEISSYCQRSETFLEQLCELRDSSSQLTMSQLQRCPNHLSRESLGMMN